MDRKTVIIVIASFAVLFFLHGFIIPRFFPPIPVPQSTNVTSTASATNLGTNAAAPTNLTPAQPTVSRAPATPAAITLATDMAEQTVTLTNAVGDAVYTFTSHGGGLKEVQLTRYLEMVGCDRTPGTNVYAKLNDHARVPVLAMQAEQLLGDNVFQLSRTSPTTLTAEKTLPSGLRVVKQFDIRSNYQVFARLRVENPTTEGVTFPSQTVSVGTATPMGPRDDGLMMGVYWFNGDETEHLEKPFFDPASGCIGIGRRAARAEHSSGQMPVHWAAVHNQFFTIALVPATNGVAQQFTTYRVPLPRPTAEDIAADSQVIRDPHGLEGALSYPAMSIPAGTAIERQFTIYAGPKQEKLLSSVGRRTGDIMDFGFFGWISKLMLRVMNAIYGVIAPVIPPALGKYAMALVAMTILIKLVFWPLTQKSTKSMKRMAALAPETKKIQEKYKDDPMKAQKKVMELWREHKVSPMSGCWPMLIQLPIFFALFKMIPNAIELRGQPFLWACDLSKPDTVFVLPGLNFPLNPLPVLMGVTMLIQARMQPPSPGMDPAQQAMLKYMPLIFMVFLYNQPAGLTLYWTVQNLLTIVQTKLTKTTDEPPTAPPAPVAPVRKKK